MSAEWCLTKEGLIGKRGKWANHQTMIWCGLGISQLPCEGWDKPPQKYFETGIKCIFKNTSVDFIPQILSLKCKLNNCTIGWHPFYLSQPLRIGWKPAGAMIEMWRYGGQDKKKNQTKLAVVLLLLIYLINECKGAALYSAGKMIKREKSLLGLDCKNKCKGETKMDMCLIAKRRGRFGAQALHKVWAQAQAQLDAEF